MLKRIQHIGPTVKRIRTTLSPLKRIDGRAVAEALGAEPCADRLYGKLGPISLSALGSELFRRRQSSGGRPGIEGTDFRAKIPLAEQDWARLERIANSLSTEGFSPSAGQVASLLLS